MDEAERKARVEAAIAGYYKREEKKYAPKSTRKNAKPEKAVEVACVTWMRGMGWDVQIIESKATWSPAARCWKQQGTRAGTCDCVGNTKEGHAIFVEFKAPGKLSTFWENERQSDFIIAKIRSGAFACVVDSVDRLAAVYSGWLRARSERNVGASFLMSVLPKKKGEK